MCYEHMQKHEPTVLKRLQAGTFEEELHRLLLRYADGTTCKLYKDKPITNKHQRTLPTKLRNSLHQLFGCCRERFASPLNIHAETAEYWSVHERDQIFAARYNAYSCKWTGLSMAVPDFDDHAAAQAVKWAVQSAVTADQPTLTLMVLPSRYASHSTSDYYTQLGMAGCHWRVLLEIPRALLKYEAPANRPLEEAKELHWRTRLIAVGNAAGFEQWCPLNYEWRCRFEEAVVEALDLENDSKTRKQIFNDANWATRCAGAPAGRHEAQWKAKMASRFRRKPPDSNRPRAAELNSETPLQDTNVTTDPGPVELLHDWRKFIYTDGSVVDAGTPG